VRLRQFHASGLWPTVLTVVGRGASWRRWASWQVHRGFEKKALFAAFARGERHQPSRTVLPADKRAMPTYVWKGVIYPSGKFCSTT
jgi:hypothetical protein